MAPKEPGTHEWRLLELEAEMKDKETRVTKLEHWRTGLIGAWIIIAAIGGFVVTTANSAVAVELINLRRELAQQRGVKVP